MKSTAFILLLALAFPAAFAGQFDDKTLEYFTKKYGQPKFIRVNTWALFADASGNTTTVNGGFFNVQEFQDGDMKITVTFFSPPPLRFAMVQFMRPKNWTPEQTNAGLAEYGGKWKNLIGGTAYNKLWVASDGSIAMQPGIYLTFQTKAAVDLAAKQLLADEAKQKAAAKPDPKAKPPAKKP